MPANLSPISGLEVFRLRTSTTLDCLVIIEPSSTQANEIEIPGCRFVKRTDKIFSNEEEIAEDRSAHLDSLFAVGFSKGYKKVIIVSEEVDDFQKLVTEAIAELSNADVVLGPTERGSFYIIGMKIYEKHMFCGKAWDSPFLNYQMLSELIKRKISFQLLPLKGTSTSGMKHVC